MICVSKDCQQPSKIGCQNCFLESHFHKDILELKPQGMLDHKMRPFVDLSKRRQELAREAREGLEFRRRKMEEILQKELSDI